MCNRPSPHAASWPDHDENSRDSTISRHFPIPRRSIKQIAAIHAQQLFGRCDCIRGLASPRWHSKVIESRTHDDTLCGDDRSGSLGQQSCRCTSSHEPLPLTTLGMTSPLDAWHDISAWHSKCAGWANWNPLGATELATPGVSPITSGAAPMIGTTCAEGCAASATAFTPMASSMGPGSSVGMVGIPLGSTELGGGGLSPPSAALSLNPSAPFMSSLPPPSMVPSFSPSLSLLTPQSAAPCLTAQTGVPTPTGLGTLFGVPLTGTAFRLQADTGCR
jgi:hypothetical protein